MAALRALPSVWRSGRGQIVINSLSTVLECDTGHNPHSDSVFNSAFGLVEYRVIVGIVSRIALQDS